MGVTVLKFARGEIMQKTFSDGHLEGSNNRTESADLPVRPAWVKPALERLSLKDALGGAAGTADCPAPGS